MSFINRSGDVLHKKDWLTPTCTLMCTHTHTHKVNNCRCDVISIPMAPVIVNGRQLLCLSHKSVLFSLACNTEHKQSQLWSLSVTAWCGSDTSCLLESIWNLFDWFGTGLKWQCKITCLESGRICDSSPQVMWLIPSHIQVFGVKCHQYFSDSTSTQW